MPKTVKVELTRGYVVNREGLAPGTVLSLPKKDADALLEGDNGGPIAVPYDADKIMTAAKLKAAELAEIANKAYDEAEAAMKEVKILQAGDKGDKSDGSEADKGGEKDKS